MSLPISHILLVLRIFRLVHGRVFNCRMKKDVKKAVLFRNTSRLLACFHVGVHEKLWGMSR